MEVIRQYETLSNPAAHDDVGVDGQQDEDDERFAAFQAAANLQRSVSQIIDAFVAERGGHTDEGHGRLPPMPQDMAAGSPAQVLG